jgi:cytochrome c peroxidase
MPGDAAFDDLPADVQDQVNRFFSNTGKALDAYMRKNATSAAPLDAFLAGQSSQLIEPAQRGLNVFLENKCQSCHSGPMLSDESFHDVGLPSLPDAKPDPGRAGGLPILQQNPFNLEGPYADQQADDTAPKLPVAGADDNGAFRTPSLRNVTLTFPYGHDGALASLNDVLAAHAPQLSDDDQNDLLTFFQSLSGAYPTPPWNDWPSPQ